MRVRHKPWAKDLIAQHPELVITDPYDKKGHWHEIFANDHPIHVEVGTRKGQFLIEMAKTYPEINFIGIEMISDVLVMALQKAMETELSNLRFIRGDGNHVSDMFAEEEVGEIYLNFSDPWPKKRHAKRRLTHENFLKQYQDILKPDGRLIFKTDNQGLFEYSLTSLSHYGMVLDDVSLDLHNSGVTDNIMTEYEAKFSQKGQRIYRLIAHFKSWGTEEQILLIKKPSGQSLHFEHFRLGFS